MLQKLARCALLASSGIGGFSKDVVAFDVTRERPWTVRESIEMRYFVTGQTSPAYIEPTESAIGGKFSPDGRHFFVATRRGSLKQDEVIYEVFVFETEVISARLKISDSGTNEAPRPKAVIAIASTRPGDDEVGIRDIRWSDNDTLTFLGTAGNNPVNGYQFRVSHNSLVNLTCANTDVVEIQAGTEGVIYAVDNEEATSPFGKYPATVISGDAVFSLFSPPRRTNRIISRYHGGDAQFMAQSELGAPRTWFAPTGAFAVMVFAPTGWKIPKEWSHYYKPVVRHYQFILADLRTGELTPMLDAPVGAATSPNNIVDTSVLWSPDGRRVILFNTALPLSTDDMERTTTAYIVEYDVETRHWTKIASIETPRMEDPRLWTGRAHWTNPGEEFVVEYINLLKRPSVWRRFARKEGGWKLQDRTASKDSVSPDDARPFNVELRQDANTPPMVWAVQGSKSLRLFGEDPVLAGVRVHPTRTVHWIDPDGAMEEGGLIIPQAQANQTLKLVVQAYRYSPAQFLPDGMASSAYASQLLAQKGFAVLQMNIPAENRPDVTLTTKEGEYFMARLDAAIDSLRSESSLDLSEIGLVGFSRGGYMAYYAATHPHRTKVGAVVVADAWQGSYGDYLYDVGTSRATQSLFFHERQYGGPFWYNQATWLALAPGFNVQKSDAPVLFQINSRFGVVPMLEAMTAFRRVNRPAEFLLFPDGSHQLIRPQQRRTSLESTVDWLTFWLGKREDLDEGGIMSLPRWKEMQDSRRASRP
ncbi:MAG: hypothetical protein JWM32_2888 [Verrucomicrobia bacterium]|nr:hypothetical protein [Verrucomicrobiota bacterium]